MLVGLLLLSGVELEVICLVSLELSCPEFCPSQEGRLSGLGQGLDISLSESESELSSASFEPVSQLGMVDGIELGKIGAEFDCEVVTVVTVDLSGLTLMLLLADMYTDAVDCVGEVVAGAASCGVLVDIVSEVGGEMALLIWTCRGMKGIVLALVGSD